MEEFKTVAPELKRELGQQLNRLKQEATDRINALREELQNAAADRPAATDDLTRPGTAERLGSRHPIASSEPNRRGLLAPGLHRGRRTRNRGRLARLLGAQLPARAPPHATCRTRSSSKRTPTSCCARTSSIQVRTMERQKPPIRVICPGRVFRNEAISYRAHCIFHQIEGLYIDEGVSFADMKQSLALLRQGGFGEQTVIRMRPSCFPSPNRRPRWTCRATSAGARAARCARARAGSKSWAAAWWTPTCSRQTT